MRHCAGKRQKGRHTERHRADGEEIYRGRDRRKTLNGEDSSERETEGKRQRENMKWEKKQRWREMWESSMETTAGRIIKKAETKRVRWGEWGDR